MTTMVRPLKHSHVLGIAVALTGGVIGYLALANPLASSSVVWKESHKDALPVGSKAADLSLSTADGDTIRLSALKGQFIGVVFVKARCPYCAKMQKELEKLELSEQRRLLIICPTKEEARELRGMFTYTSPILVDSTQDVFRAYKVSGVPTVYLIDAAGRIESMNMGWPNIWIERFREGKGSS